jgi:hypothetical protein
VSAAAAPRDDRPLWGLVAFAAAFLALGHLVGGCAARVQCPGWAMPVRVDTGLETTAAGNVSVGTSTLPPQGDGSASFKSSSSVDFSCKGACPKGTLTEWSRSRDGSETLKCIPAPAVKP